jgi:hypothetical protein
MKPESGKTQGASWSAAHSNLCGVPEHLEEGIAEAVDRLSQDEGFQRHALGPTGFGQVLVVDKACLPYVSVMACYGTFNKL